VRRLSNRSRCEPRVEHIIWQSPFASVTPSDKWMPQGFENIEEATLPEAERNFDLDRSRNVAEDRADFRRPRVVANHDGSLRASVSK